MPPPPPPPPLCFPSSKKPHRRLSWSSSDPHASSLGHDEKSRHRSSHSRSSPKTRSSSSTLNRGAPGHQSHTSLTFHSDSEKYDTFSSDEQEFPKHLSRNNTLVGGATLISRGNGTKKSTASSKWGYGWTLNRRRDKYGVGQSESNGANLSREMSQKTMASQKSWVSPAALEGATVKRSDSKSTQASKSSSQTKASKSSQQTSSSKASTLPIPIPPGIRPTYNPHDSSDTLVGSMLERKVAEPQGEFLKRVDTTLVLSEMRKLLEKEQLDYYIIPHDDAHMSEYVAERDQRVKFISGFSGSAGTAVVTRSNAYLFTDSRYWLQAHEQIDNNWTLIECGKPGKPTDWVEWLLGRIKNSKIGLDARMLSHETASSISSKLSTSSSRFVYPLQNLVDLVWKDHSQPPKSKQEIYLHGIEFAGVEARDKLKNIRKYLSAHPPDVPAYSRNPATPSQQHSGILISHLPAIAWTLNLRGCDIPYNPLFHAYLFIGLDRSVLFIDAAKVPSHVHDYLARLDISIKEYQDIWQYLRRREWGEGKLLITPHTSYAISLMLTHFRYTVEQSYVERTMAVKNEVEIAGMKRAYLRDGVSFVRFLAWLEEKLAQGYEVSEWEAAWRLTEFRRKSKYFMGLAYGNISASGPNAALPHYTPAKGSSALITRETPYLNDSGGQYSDGTCDTTRTVHFGRPTAEQCEAYTKVLQGHIAIDSAVFPEGTSGYQLDVLARKALWKEGMNYMHGTGHGFGQFLTVHEGPQGFSSNVPLLPGMCITNEPGFYKEGHWGVRIESALFVKRVQTKHSFHGDRWLGFERLTVVPIQTRMVNPSMLTKDEKAWIKTHNKLCYEKLSPQLKDDSRAMKYLKRETERDIGLAPALAGAAIDWG